MHKFLRGIWAIKVNTETAFACWRSRSKSRWFLNVVRLSSESSTSGLLGRCFRRFRKCSALGCHIDSSRILATNCISSEISIKITFPCDELYFAQNFARPGRKWNEKFAEAPVLRSQHKITYVNSPRSHRVMNVNEQVARCVLVNGTDFA